VVIAPGSRILPADVRAEEQYSIRRVLPDHRTRVTAIVDASIAIVRVGDNITKFDAIFFKVVRAMQIINANFCARTRLDSRLANWHGFTTDDCDGTRFGQSS